MKTCFEAEYQNVTLNVSVKILIFSCVSRCRYHLIVSGVCESSRCIRDTKSLGK